MKESMGADYVDLADYFDACRVKRNVIDYDRAGGISAIVHRRVAASGPASSP
jgi:hypothetical protein